MIKFNKKFWDNLPTGHYDKTFSQDIQENNIKYLWHYLTFINQQKFLKPNIKHLDFACGPGTLIGVFSKSKSIGFDPAKNQIQYAVKNYQSKNKIFTSNIEDIYKHKDFNLITINGLFEYLDLKEINTLLKELENVYEENCKFIITTPNYGGAFRLVEYISTKLNIIDYKDVNKSRFSHKSLKSLFGENKYKNLKIKKIVNIGVLLGFINGKLAIYIEKLIEKIFVNKFGFILMVEFDLIKNEK